MRKVEHGLFYFPLDCNFFQNKKIKMLRRAQGSVGVLTYINLLCRIYQNGYYITFDDINELSMDIAEDIACDQLRRTSTQVTETIFYLVRQDILDERLFEQGVMSGKAIQRQYVDSINRLKRKAEIDLYSLLPKNEEGSGVGGSTPKNTISSEFIPINSEETTVNSEEKHKRERESKKENITPTTAHARGKHGNVILSEAEYADLLSRIPNTDAYIDTFSEKLYNHGYSYNCHYDAILKWWNEDKNKPKKKAVQRKPDNVSFDTDDFFAAAVNRGRNKK